jgi:hypothetical protein
MENLLLPLAFLACPIGMGLMMFFMMRGMRGGHEETKAGHRDAMPPEEKLARLEAEKRTLEQQLASPEERLAHLEAEKQALELQLRANGNGKAADRVTASLEGQKVPGKPDVTIRK